MISPTSQAIADRIAAQAGVPNLAEILARLPASDLQSLLLHVFQARAGGLDISAVLRSADRSLLQASKIDARLLNEFDRVAFREARGFEAIELSPVCPLGLNRVLGGIDQNSVLTTIRHAEVLGDATMPLALECARRRKETSRRGDPTPVRLITSQRMIRLQPFDVPGYVPHFRLWSMVSAGRDTGSQAFETEHLGEHLRFYLRFFRSLADHGFRLARPLVELSDTRVVQPLLAAHGVSSEDIRQSIRAHRLEGSEQFLADRGIVLPSAIADPGRELAGLVTGPALDRLARLNSNLLDPLRSEFPEAQFRFNFTRLEGLNYYTGFTLRISPLAPDGIRYPVGDGGFTDWTASLLRNKKERMLTSGIGTEFVCFKYRAAIT
jgi:hypothetical protein